MIQHEVAIHINRPVDEVFEYLADARNLCAWQADLVENEQLTEGTTRVGTRFREVRRTGPRQSEILAEITAFEPSRRFATKTLEGPRATVSYALHGEQGGTGLTYQFTLQTSGFMRLLEPFLARSIKKDTGSDLEKLKCILEG